MKFGAVMCSALERRRGAAMLFIAQSSHERNRYSGQADPEEQEGGGGGGECGGGGGGGGGEGGGGVGRGMSAVPSRKLMASMHCDAAAALLRAKAKEAGCEPITAEALGADEAATIVRLTSTS